MHDTNGSLASYVCVVHIQMIYTRMYAFIAPLKSIAPNESKNVHNILLNIAAAAAAALADSIYYYVNEPASTATAAIHLYSADYYGQTEQLHALNA